MIVALFRAFWRVALSVFFRRVEVRGLEHVPARGPLLLVSNHANAFIDALLLLAFLPRRLVVTAKSVLKKDPFFDLVFVRGHDLVLLHRPQDRALGADPAKNADALAALGERLARGDAVLVFPEGVSHSDPALRPFRTGAARLAAAHAARGAEPLTILPVGLTYEAKSRFRSSVVVRIGAPVPAPSAEDDPVALTRELERRVEALVDRAAARPLVAPRPARLRSVIDALRTVEVLLLGAPVAALGALLHGLPCAVVRAIARRRSTDEDHWATNAVVPSVAVFPLYYALLVGAAAVALPAWGALALLPALPFTALVALTYRDRLQGRTS